MDEALIVTFYIPGRRGVRMEHRYVRMKSIGCKPVGLDWKECSRVLTRYERDSSDDGHWIILTADGDATVRVIRLARWAASQDGSTAGQVFAPRQIVGEGELTMAEKRAPWRCWCREERCSVGMVRRKDVRQTL